MNKYLLILFSFVALNTIAQTEDEWTLFSEEIGVKFYKQYTDCQPKNIPNQEGVIIKIVNTNNYEVEISWNLRIWYDDEEQTQNIKDKENHITVVVPKRGTLSGSCGQPSGALYIFKKFITFTGGVDMTHFSFEDILIKKIR